MHLPETCKRVRSRRRAGCREKQWHRRPSDRRAKCGVRGVTPREPSCAPFPSLSLHFTSFTDSPAVIVAAAVCLTGDLCGGSDTCGLQIPHTGRTPVVKSTPQSALDSSVHVAASGRASRLAMPRYVCKVWTQALKLLVLNIA